jgi:hypothetical protein
MSTTKSLGKKSENDKFYTKPEVARRLLNKICLDDYDLFIEPSAGNGSFSKLFPGIVAMDIEPEDESITKFDFFDYTPYSISDGKILVFGNPPFGQQNSLAIQFINHSAKWADAIAFILPRSFKKISVQNRVDLNFSLDGEYEIEDNSFLLNGESYSVPTVFQIWKRGPPRKKIKLPTTTDLFNFTTMDNADLRIQRVGGNAGKASLDLNYSAQSNYFIKLNCDYTPEEFVDFINDLDFPSVSWAVGPKSLSKGEMIQIIEEKTNEI